MPREKPGSVRRRRGLDPALRALLRGEPCPPDGDDFKHFLLWPIGAPNHLPGLELYEAWEANRDRLLAEWIVDHPGTRPPAWWWFEAREPRRQTGGPEVEMTDQAPQETRDREHNEGWGWRLQLGCRIRPPWFPEIGAVLTWESQATYLRRLGLLAEGEEERVPEDEWEDEATKKHSAVVGADHDWEPAPKFTDVVRVRE